MSDPTTIKINPAKNSDLEFDVLIQGMDHTELPTVKFAITSEASQCDYVFYCTKMEGDDVKNRWLAKLPALLHIKESTVKFHVEVIIDGYYFEPALGTVILVTDPSVKFQPNVTKPTVTTSFVVRQDDDPPEETPKKKAVKEASGGGEITGQFAPTNDLLKPEFPPPESHVKTPNAEKDDQAIDMKKLASHVLPGETTDPEPQEGNNVADQPDDEEDFDARRVAEEIVRKTLGPSMSRPTTQGSLFKRRADGSAIVEGLDTPAEKAAKVSKAQKVKDILKGK